MQVVKYHERCAQLFRNNRCFLLELLLAQLDQLLCICIAPELVLVRAQTHVQTNKHFIPQAISCSNNLVFLFASSSNFIAAKPLQRDLSAHATCFGVCVPWMCLTMWMRMWNYTYVRMQEQFSHTHLLNSFEWGSLCYTDKKTMFMSHGSGRRWSAVSNIPSKDHGLRCKRTASRRVCMHQWVNTNVLSTRSTYCLSFSFAISGLPLSAEKNWYASVAPDFSISRWISTSQ